MSEQQTYASLLQNLSVNRVITLLHEKVAQLLPKVKLSEASRALINNFLHVNLRNASSGYPVHFIYAIDPYDITTYSFPFGFTFQQATLNGSELDIISDKQTGWDSFYSSHPRLILMDEHRPELGRIRKRLIQEMETSLKGYEEFDDLEKYIRHIYNSKDVDQLTDTEIEYLKNQIFKKRLSWLVAAATGELHNGPKRFSFLLKKLIIKSDQFDESIVSPGTTISQKEKHLDVITNVFQDTPASSFAFKQYEKRLQQLEARDVEFDNYRKENLLADFNVADRILNINRKFELLAKELNCRYVVLYLASDKKTEQTSNELYSKCPPLLGEPFNLLRNVSQLWLNSLLSLDKPTELTEANSQEQKETEETIGNLAIIINTIGQKKLEEIGEIRQRIDALRERVEWSGLIKNIAVFPEDLLKAFEALEKRSTFEPLKFAFADLIQTLKNTTGKDGLRAFKQEIRNFSIEVTVLQKLISVLKTDPTPDISSLGYVVGINHHLPTLFKKADQDSKYELLISRTVSIVLSPNSKNFGEKLKQVSNELKSILLSDTLPDIRQYSDGDDTDKKIQHYERQTLLHLFTLILPSKKIEVNAEKNVKTINLDSELDTLLEADIHSIFFKKNLDDDNQYSNKLRIIGFNLIYIRLWSLRRNDKFDQCEKLIQYTESLINNGTLVEDVRIYHAKALLSYSKLIEIVERHQTDDLGYFVLDEGEKKYWKQAQRDIETAIGFYNNPASKLGFEEVPFDKAYSALLNTLIYTYTIGYFITKDFQRLSISRKIMDEQMQPFNDDRRNNPEYLHTEAFLEYAEALYHLGTDSKKSLTKIRYALNAIEECLKLSKLLFPLKDDDKDYKELQHKIEIFTRLNFERQPSK